MYNVLKENSKILMDLVQIVTKGARYVQEEISVSNVEMITDREIAALVRMGCSKELLIRYA